VLELSFGVDWTDGVLDVDGPQARDPLSFHPGLWPSGAGSACCEESGGQVLGWAAGGFEQMGAEVLES